MSGQYRPGRAWFITGLLAIFMLINFIDKIAIGLVAVPLMAELNLSPTEFGIVAGSFFWLFAIAGIAGGFLANHMSAKWLLLGMAVLWSLAQVPILLSSSVAVLIIARVLLGVGEGPSYPVAAHACYKWFPNGKRNLPVTTINLGSTFGLLIAGAVIPVISTHWGWRANFMLLGAIGVVWGVAWLVFGEEGTIETERPASASVAARRVPYSQLLSDPSVIGIIIVHFVAFWGLALTLTWLPAYLQNGLGYTAILSGQMFALVVLIGVPINLGLSWWSQRMLARGASSRTSRAALCCTALIVAGAMFIALAHFDFTPFQKILLLAVASALTPAIYSLGPAMMSEVSPDSQRGGMIAIENSIASMAGLLAPIVTGRLVEVSSGAAAHGYEQGFVVSGALLILGAIVGLVMVNPQKSIARQAVRAAQPTLNPMEQGAA